MLGGLDLDLLQALVDTAAPRDHSFPFIDYRIIGQSPYNNPTNPIVTPFLSVCGSTPLSATSYHVSIAQKTINIFNPELCKSSTPIQYVAGTHYQLNGFPLRICWDHDGAFLSIHAVITSTTGTFTQNTTVNVTQGIPTICSQHSSVSFDNGSTCGSQLIYTRSHDLDGTSSHEQFHQNGWATSAHKPLYDNRL